MYEIKYKIRFNIDWYGRGNNLSLSKSVDHKADTPEHAAYNIFFSILSDITSSDFYFMKDN